MNHKAAYIAAMLVCTPILGVTVKATGTISGFVKDSTNSESLSFVNVFIQGAGRGAATNRDGYYVISGVPLDTMTVAASIIGYRMARQKVDLTAQPNLRLDFFLTPTVLVGEEVTVTAERQRFERAVEVSTVTLDTRAINIAPAFVEADVFRTLQLLPGVQSVSDYSSALYVRGSTPDQNLILLDGITVYNPSHLGGIFSTFNTDAIKEAEFIAGGFSAKHGGRMGSVLEIVNRDGNAEQFSGKVNISLISSKALLEGPLPKIGPVKGSWMVAGRRTYFDKIINAAAWATGIAKESWWTGFPYYFYDVQGKVNLDIGDSHRLVLSTFKGKDILHYTELSDGNRYRFQVNWPWGNTTYGATWRWIISPRLISRVTLSSSRFGYDIAFDETRTYDNGHNEWGIDIIERIGDRSVRGELTYLPTERHNIIVGMEHKRLDYQLGWLSHHSLEIDNINESRVDTIVWIEHRPYEQAFYLEDTWRPTPLLILKAGLRASRYSLHGATNPEPRLSGKWFVQSNLAVTAAWGRYFQYLLTANSSDENLRIIDLWLPAPPDHPAPVSEHLIVGLEYLTNTNTLFKMEVYRKTFDNLTYLKQSYLFFLAPVVSVLLPSDSLSGIMSRFLPAAAKAHGLELLVKKNAGKVKGWLGYTLAQTLWKTGEQDWYPPKYDRTHTLNLVTDWQLNDRWHFSSAYTYTTGNPYTPVLGTYSPYFGASTPGWPRQYQYLGPPETYLWGGKNSARYPDYHRWDISLVRKTTWRNRGTKEYYIQVINVLNHVNVLQYFYYQDWDDESKRMLLHRLSIPMFPVFPSIGVRYEF